MRALVTGGTGFVGSWCVAELLLRGYEVRTTVRSVAKAEALRTAVRAGLEHFAEAGRAPQGVSAAELVERVEGLELAQADLTSDEGWEAAFKGVDLLLHVASPLNIADPDDEEAFFRPAIEGTRRVLGAAVAAGVQKAVVTSSAAACTTGSRGAVTMDDHIWTDDADPLLTPYRRSKILAEREAWAVAQENPGLRLATVLPGAILGMPLPGVSASSAAMVERMVTGRGMPLAPKVEMAIVDVRDLARLHADALESDAADGQRFLGAGEVMTVQQVAMVATAMRPISDGPKAVLPMPDPLLRLAARFNKELHPVAAMAGRKVTVNAERARTVLGWSQRPAVQSIEETAKAYLNR